MRFFLSLPLILTIALLAAAPASAGVACTDFLGAAAFTANDAGGACPAPPPLGPSEVNQLTVGTNPTGDIVFTDINPIADGDGAGGCTVSGNTATCPRGTGYLFALGDGADSATIGTAPAAPLGVSNAGPGADSIAGGPGAENVTGGDGNDSMNGGDGNDVLDGGLGDDSVNGDGGNDAVTGGDGGDAVNGGNGDDSVNGGAGGDTVTGGDGDDALEGGIGFIGCLGSGGDDALDGGPGNDLLCGGGGAAGGVADKDSLSGGPDVDHAFYPGPDAVSLSLDGVANDGVPGEGDTVQPDVEDLTGGSAGDTLTGNDGPNLLDGAGGADALTGLDGNDTLTDSGGDRAGDTQDGGAGDDTLGGGRGGDVYAGGDGQDLVIDYAGRNLPVAVTLDGKADDGQAGEGDNVGPDVEDVTGGSAGDTLTGNASDNELAGGAGDDVIAGGDGNDGLLGQAGRDTIEGGGGRDRIDGGGGSDALKSRDGLTDRVDCAGGTDSVEAEARDDIAGDCENLDIAPPTAVTIASVVVTRSGFVVVRVACPEVERSCSGVVIVKTVRRVAKRFIRLGQVNYRLRGGESRALRARISARDRTALKKARRVKVRAVVTNANSDTGKSTNATKLATVTTRGL